MPSATITQQPTISGNLPVQMKSTGNNLISTTSSAKTNRRSKISRQLRSLSSSDADDDEDLGRFQQQISINMLPQQQDTTTPSIAIQPTDPDFSEKGLLILFKMNCLRFLGYRLKNLINRKNNPIRLFQFIKKN